MDIYYPNQMTGPAPVILYIHGGGWHEGDKRQIEPIISDALRAAGFMVISLNYRLGPEYPFPAQIQDLKCAVRHLRAEANRYGLDPDAIGALGTSAGGHLAALLGLTDAPSAWDVGSNPGQSSKVAAVATFYMPADLTMTYPGIELATREGAFGPNPSAEFMKEASSIGYVTPDDAPFLFIHGIPDAHVPPEQSQILHELLVAAGVPSEVVLVQGGTHAFLAAEHPVQPSREELAALVVEFFNAHLKP
jgi:acetyl esterase/lipase